MLRIVLALATVVALLPVCHAQSSPIEVLYVAEGPTNQPGTLLTYNVNPETAVAERVGNSLAVRATNVEPLSIGGKNLVYVWNSNAVWVYIANARGVPGTLLQHLIFGFAHPVFTFLVDPDGKFAYAIMTWFAGSQYRTSIVLFTIDQFS